MDAAVVPTVYVRELIALLEEEEGVPARALLQGTGVSQRLLRDAEALITHAEQLRVYENAVARSARPGLGLRLGARYRHGHHGVLGHAMLCAKNVREQLRFVLHYAEIRGYLLGFDFREACGTAVLSAHERYPLGAVHVTVVEELLGMLAGGRVGTPRSRDQRSPGLWPPPREVRVDYPAPRHRGRYERLLGCPIHFDAGAIEVHFESRALDVASTTSNAEVARICEERCQSILHRMGSGGAMVDRVRSHVVAGRDGFRLEEVARRMALSPRTLRRRLRDEGTSFRGVIADVRKGLALDYLESSDLGLEEIASLLGYEDTANFNRAFRRWVGESPGRHRRRRRVRAS